MVTRLTHGHPRSTGVMQHGDKVALRRSTTHDAAEDALSALQLRNTILQELSVALRARWLRSNRLYFRIRQAADSDRAKYLLKATDHVAFDDLGGDVGDESFLGDLDSEFG